MDAKEMVFKLLYLALLEIREEAYETKNGKIFPLADLFDGVPLQLRQATEGQVSFEEVMTSIWQRAEGKPTKRWLEHTIAKNLWKDLSQ